MSQKFPIDKCKWKKEASKFDEKFLNKAWWKYVAHIRTLKHALNMD